MDYLLPCRLGSGEAPRTPEDGSCRRMKKRWGLRNRCYRRPEEAIATDGEAMPLMEGSRTPNRCCGCCCRRRRRLLLLLNLRRHCPSAPKDPPRSAAPRLQLCEGDAKGRIRFQDPRADPAQAIRATTRAISTAQPFYKPIQSNSILLFTWPIYNP